MKKDKTKKDDITIHDNSEDINSKSENVLVSEDNNDNTKTGNKKKLKRNLIIAGLAVLLVGLVIGSVYYYLNKFQYRGEDVNHTQDEIDQFEQEQMELDAAAYGDSDGVVIHTPEPTTPSPTFTFTPEPEKELRYILLIGIDARSSTNWENASSDVMKLLVIDEENNEIKIISFMRDMLVEIEGQTEEDGSQKYGKLNAVYFFNGPDGLCTTLKNQFKIPVDEYVIINWAGVANLVDAMGGVEVDVKSSEIKCINEAIGVQNRLRSIEYASSLYRNGLQVLNGNQALAYCRVRECGNGDYDRVNRQVVVMKSLFAGLKDASFDEILALMDVLQEVVKTNISPTSLIKYAEIGYGMLDADFTSLSVPVGEVGETHTAGWYNKRYVLKIDFEANINAIESFINDEPIVLGDEDTKNDDTSTDE